MPLGALIKAPSSNSIYLLTETGKRHVTSWSLAIALAGGPPALVSVSPEFISALHDAGPLLTPGSLVRADGENAVYFIASDNSRVWLPSFTLSRAAGIDGVQVVDSSKFVAYSIRPDNFAHGFTCGDVAYIAGNGAVHQVPTELRANYAGLPLVDVSEAVCRGLRVGAPATPFVGAPDGRIYRMEDGRKRWIASWSRWLEVSGGSTWTPVTTAFVDAVPTGDPV
jgi:hypothetical protein